MDLMSVPAQRFREKQADYLAEVKAGGHVALSRYGTTVGVVVPPQDHRRMSFAVQAVKGLTQRGEQQDDTYARDIQKVPAHIFRRDQAVHLEKVEKESAHIAITRYQETLAVVIPIAQYEHASFAVRLMDGFARLAEADGPNDLSAFAARVTEEMAHHHDLDGQQQLLLEEVAQAS
ncbi:hypothetical protein GCM10027258_79680 [Amycolatopsis stemonae]